MEKNLVVFEDAWLGLGDLSQIIVDHNPMIGRTKEDIETPDLHLLRLLRNPKYFGTTVKLLFDIDLLNNIPLDNFSLSIQMVFAHNIVLIFHDL